MSTPAAFSRLQLAAALLEYDNDPDDPTAPYRSAQDSAIFAHFRRNPAAKPGTTSRRRNDLLDVSFPSETGSLGGRYSAYSTRHSRHSRGSIDALRNPFSGDVGSEFGIDEEEEENGEVDLASWGLDAFTPKPDKGKPSTKSKSKISVPSVEAARPLQPSANQPGLLTSPRRGRVTSKSVSVGGMKEYFEHDAPEPSTSRLAPRRASFASPLDLAGMELSGEPLVPPTTNAPPQPSLTPPAMIPFPTSSVRSPSPGPDASYFSATRDTLYERRQSIASLGSRFLVEETKETHETRSRHLSNGSMAGPVAEAHDNPFALEAGGPTSRFDPQNPDRGRRHSNASLGTMLQGDNASTFTRDRPMSTFELLRPKVLVMPSPLQPVNSEPPTQPTPRALAREGFQLSTDGPPLPPGARSSRRLSNAFADVPNPSSSFTPNPLGDLTLSQKIFRNTLPVSGAQGAYADVLPRATEDGEQALLDPMQERPEPAPRPPTPEEEGPFKQHRPAGKLFGKSLIDDLETRKVQMKSKQRVFTGDERPSMMARGRQSTLIDPASLRPPNPRTDSFATQRSSTQRLSRSNSLGVKPLINFDDESPVTARPATRDPVRSVFGVDTLWEREMAKLKEMEAEEARYRVETEEVERRREEKKGKKKRKGANKEPEPDLLSPPLMNAIQPESRVSVEPPVLPDIERQTGRRPPPRHAESDSDSDDDDDDRSPHAPRTKHATAPSWHAGSSDEEDAGPRRTTGVGPRYRAQPVHSIPDDDSDEDVPLAATVHKAMSRAALSSSGRLGGADDSDEDQPLAQVIRNKGRSDAGSSSNHAPRDRMLQPRLGADGSDEDDQPLGLRMSRMNPIPHTSQGGDGEEEDDVPLAFHPEQQRRTQYQMFAQQQQQQQMMAAQFQSNMFMSPPMMNPGYFVNPMMNPMAMMQMPMQIPSPPPVPDEAKFGLVDRWRRDVAGN